MKQIMKLFVVFAAVVLVSMESAAAFAFFQYSETINNVNNNSVHIGDFAFGSSKNECNATVVIDELFYNKYMTLTSSGSYVWKTDSNGNILNINDIKALTPMGTIIKSDICYEVMNTNYNLIDQGIPQKTNPQGWALHPMQLEYILNWVYNQNRVVKASDGNYYMARYYITSSPVNNRAGWDKIEPVKNTDFEFYPNSTIPNYQKPILNNIKRAYSWDKDTTYLAGDVVTADGKEYVAIQSSMNQKPKNKPWAWQLV